MKTKFAIAYSGRILLVILACIVTTTQVIHAQESAPVEGWPRVYKSEGNKFIVYQPQIQSWEDHKIMKAVSAVQVDLKSLKDDVFGAIYVQADTETNSEVRMVVFKNIKITDIRFPNVKADTVKLCDELIRKTISPKTSIPIALDRVIAAMDRSELQQRNVEVNLDPPPIYYSSKPAILMIFLGDPKFEPVKNTELLFAVNTNWDLFLDTRSKNYYLLNGDSWLMTKEVLKGPWTSASRLPQSLYKLPNDKNWEDVKKNLSVKRPKNIPSVFVSTVPAELIITDGPPSLTMIPETKLFYIENTNSHLFFNLNEQNYYFLTAGRWFRAKDLKGPWTSASNDLPVEFAKIPKDHIKASVLASVPGSEEARAAVLLASIPQKAKVDRKGTTVTVVYEGEPEFIVIQDTTVRYAVNTPYSVFLVNNRYYCCHQGVWFESSAAVGPWAVCSVVPKAIYTIPPTHPKHNVTYVYIYDSSPEVVYVGYTSGYSGSYVTATGALMFGLGYMIGDDDDDYWDYHHYHYHSHYYSYGCGAHYDYYHGGYYRSAQYYGPYGGAGRGAAYNPATGTYSRGAYRYGPSGGAFAAQAYNPYTGRYAAKAGAQTPYGSWGRTVVADGDDWARAGHRSNWKGTVAAGQTSQGGAIVAGRSKLTGQTGVIGKSKYGDIYVGNDGDVYKRTDKGSWQKNVDGSWQSVEPSRPERTTDSLRSRTETLDRSKVQTTERTRTRDIDRSSTERTKRDSRPRRSGSQRQSSRSARGTFDQLNREQRSRQTGSSRTSRFQQSRSRGSRSGGRSGGRTRRR